MIFQQKETQGSDIPENIMNKEKKKRMFWKWWMSWVASNSGFMRRIKWRSSGEKVVSVRIWMTLMFCWAFATYTHMCTHTYTHTHTHTHPTHTHPPHTHYWKENNFLIEWRKERWERNQLDRYVKSRNLLSSWIKHWLQKRKWVDLFEGKKLRCRNTRS